jgi:hypothetical protein
MKHLIRDNMTTSTSAGTIANNLLHHHFDNMFNFSFRSDGET